MSHIRLVVDNDTAVSADTVGRNRGQGRARFVVIAAAGLFKNGRHYASGDIVELPEQSAAEFLRLKEIEPA